MEVTTIVSTGTVILISLAWFYRKKNTLLHPFSFVAAICFLVQVVAPMIWEINGTRDYRGVQIMDYIVPAELVFLLGYISFWISYSVSNPRLREPVGLVRTNDGTIDIDVTPQAVYFMWILFFALYSFYLTLKGRSLLSQLTLGQQGYYFEDASMGSGLLFLAISINMLITTACILLFVGAGKLKYLLYIVTFLLTISSGRRHLMIDIALAPLIIRYKKLNRNPNTVVLIVAVAVVYLLVGWIGAMRSVYRYGVGTLTAFDNSKAWDAVMINLEVFIPLCMYIPKFKEVNAFGLGSTYITAFLQLIPSIVFPFKRQVISFFSWGISREVLGQQFLREGIAGTFWSGLYSNGWLLGVIVGMALFGRWVKKIELKLQYKRLTYTVEFAILTTFMFQFTTRSFGNAIQDWLGLILPLLILRMIPSRVEYIL